MTILEQKLKEELKPCPFCGSTAITMGSRDYWFSNSLCRKCGTEFQFPDSGAETSQEELWNTRHIDKTMLTHVIHKTIALTMSVPWLTKDQITAKILEEVG